MRGLTISACHGSCQARQCARSAMRSGGGKALRLRGRVASFPGESTHTHTTEEETRKGCEMSTLAHWRPPSNSPALCCVDATGTNWIQAVLSARGSEHSSAPLAELCKESLARPQFASC
ncbi:hypothetical protein MRX96_040162 [Rhipicephalus microplus]